MSQFWINVILALLGICAPFAVLFTGLAAKYMSGINTKLGHLMEFQAVFTEWRKHVDRRFDEGDDRMDRIDGHIDSVDKRVGKVELHCAAVGQKEQ